MFGVRPPGMAGSKPSYRSPPGKLAFFVNIYNDPFQWSFVKSVLGFAEALPANNVRKALTISICFEVQTYDVDHPEIGRRLSDESKKRSDPNFLSFQRTYLAVYCLAVAGDWLQGPHVYALYESYWMTKHQIELLFIAGFGSSLLFGTFIGSIADKFGRKTNCLLYAVLYGVSCVTKHFADFNVLLFGRLMGGIATSILFSAFESWLVFEHRRRALSDQSLKQIFANATLANSLIAILAGIVAQTAANAFGFVAPFDCALVVLALMALTDVILFLGLVQSLFEGSMYVFVLEWTPALSRASETGTIPHGYIFASFMISVMMGSAIFNLLSQYSRPESFMRFVFFAAALLMGAPVLFPSSPAVIFVAFALFEVCVGIFWPAMGFLRSQYIPEKTRSTTMNFFRVPLNLLVIVILWNNFQLDTIFKFCVSFLLLATLIQHSIARLTSSPADGSELPFDVLEEMEKLCAERGEIGDKTDAERVDSAEESAERRVG
uniref:Molybdate-anion transporter n=1 Tax=Globodera pallida TaxID=36090 RepID=A0A183BYP2_GLOPA